MKKILLVTLTLVLTLTVFGFNSNSVSAESSHPDNIVEPGVMCENYDGYNWDYDSCGYIARDGHNTVYVEYYVIGTNATARIEFYNGGTKVSTQSLTQGSNAKVYAGAWTQFKVTFYYEDPTP